MDPSANLNEQSNGSMLSTSNNKTLNDTVSILKTYAFPKISQYYSSKGKSCILDQYKNQIIQYFINDKLSMQQFYKSSVKKSDFIAATIKSIDDQNGTQNEENYSLQTAIKKLYTILQLHQHTASSELTPTIHTNIPTSVSQQPNAAEIKRKERERMNMVHKLSTAQSELLSLQQTVDILKNIADETQKQLLQKEETEEEYKKRVNELNQKLKTDETQISEVSEVNKKLQNELQQILTLNRRLSDKMVEFEENEQSVQQYKVKMDVLQYEVNEMDNINKQLKHELDENKQEILTVNHELIDLKEELKSKEKLIEEMDEMIENDDDDFDNDYDNMDEIVFENQQHPTQIISWRDELEINSKLDCLDEECVWWTSTVTEIDGNRIKIRYDAFDDDRWDEWIDKGSTRIAPYMTKAKNNDKVSVNLKVVAEKTDKRTGKTRRIYKQGFLVKQGKRFKSYKTRYFRLYDDGTMDYFKKMTDRTATGSFNIKNMIETRRIQYPNKSDLFGFEIVTKQRTWRFQAHSDDIVAEWIGVIHAVSKGIRNNNNNNDKYRNHRSFTNVTIQKESSPLPALIRASFLSQSFDESLRNNDDEKINSNDSNIVHYGWMHKAGKWDTNWKWRFCVLSIEPVQLKCYIAPNKKQTHCIDFKNVKSCIELKKDSDQFNKLEVPTAFAFHLITSSRIYTFACKSKLDVNIWLKKIRKVVHVSSNRNTAKLTRRSSIIKLGSTLNKLGTSFGRLIGVTPEHVTTTEVLETKKVQIENNNNNKYNKYNNNGNININNNNNNYNNNFNILSSHHQTPKNERRSSSLPVPTMNWAKSQNLDKTNKGRRQSAPYLAGFNKTENMMITCNVNELENKFCGNNNSYFIEQENNDNDNDKDNGKKHRGTLNKNIYNGEDNKSDIISEQDLDEELSELSIAEQTE